MYREPNRQQRRIRRPALINTLTEAPRALLEAGSLCTLLPMLPFLPRGDGHPILLMPGFMAGDRSLGLLKRYLRYLGYRPETWELGRNTGRVEHLFARLPQRLLGITDKAGEPASLIGQSLGGVFAREMAREYPQAVRQVITLGSPFAATNGRATLRTLAQLLRVASGRSIEEMSAIMRQRNLHISPDVPVTAIYSKSDGVVHWAACREVVEDRHTQNIEVTGSHVGMAFNPVNYYIIADRLAQRPDRWKKFSWRRYRGSFPGAGRKAPEV